VVAHRDHRPRRGTRDPPFGAAVTVYGWVVVMFQIWPICYMDPGPADEVLDDS